MYLGVSPQHAGSIGCILNPSTGHVSPQFHVVYDELFTTATGRLDAESLLNDELWNELLQFGGHKDHLQPQDRDDPDVMGPAQDMFDTFSGRDYDPDSVPDLDASVSEGDGTIFANQNNQNIDETSASEGDHEPPAHRTRSRLKTHPPRNALTAATLSSIPEFKDCTNYTQTQQWEHAAGGKPQLQSLEQRHIHAPYPVIGLGTFEASKWFCQSYTSHLESTAHGPHLWWRMGSSCSCREIKQ